RGSAPAVRAVLEIRSAHRDVVRRRGQAVHRLAVHGIVGAAVATGRAVVPGRHQDGLTLRRGLLPKTVDEWVGDAEGEFTCAEAHAYHRSHVSIDSMFGGENQAAFQGRVGSNHKIDGGIGRYRSGPLDIEIGLRRVIVRAVGIVDAVHAGVVAV